MIATLSNLANSTFHGPIAQSRKVTQPNTAKSAISVIFHPVHITNDEHFNQDCGCSPKES